MSVVMESADMTTEKLPSKDFELSSTALNQPQIKVFDKIQNLKFLLSRDMIAMDAKWTLFVSSALSYCYEIQLQPFPAKYLNEHGFNIDALISVINEIPPLRIVFNQLVDEDYDQLDTEIIDLLYWVLVTCKEPILRTLSNEEFQIILTKFAKKLKTSTASLTSSTGFFSHLWKSTNLGPPTQVFEIIYPHNDKDEEQFQMLSTKFVTQLAFYGNKIDNFYPVLRNHSKKSMQSNQQHRNHDFGDNKNVDNHNNGVVLTTDLNTCRKLYSPSGAAWGASLCGSMLSCVAVCEYLDDPDYVHYYDLKTNAQLEDIQLSEPCTVVIKSNALIRLRYLLFFGVDSANNKSLLSSSLKWFYRNKYVLTIMCYTMFLVSIGIANGGNFVAQFRQLTEKSSDLLRQFKNYIRNWYMQY